MPESNNIPETDRLKNGNNLLHTCTDLSEAKDLVSRGVNVNHKNCFGQVPINALMRLDNPGAKEVVQYLMQVRFRNKPHVRINVAEPDGTTFAHLCEWGPIMSTLSSNKYFNPNKIRTSDGNTPLMLCITYPKNPDVAQRLLEDPRIDLTIRNPINGKTALELAEESTTEYGKEILKLIRNKIDGNTKSFIIAPGFVAASIGQASLLAMAPEAPTNEEIPTNSATIRTSVP